MPGNIVYYLQSLLGLEFFLTHCHFSFHPAVRCRNFFVHAEVIWGLLFITFLTFGEDGIDGYKFVSGY